MVRPGRVMSLTFLIYPCEEEPRRFVAHCLEMDVLAVEDTKAKAILLLKELIEDLLIAAEEDSTMDKVFRPAPAKYWAKLARARRYAAPPSVRRAHIDAPPVRRVDYALAL